MPKLKSILTRFPTDCIFASTLMCTFLLQIKLDFMKLLENGIVKSCREDNVKIGLF